ncbi:MAG: SDR family oxidoreductase, partial [Thermoguttaceae bacterium]
MPYHLLTGATGLLGSYLMLDNLRAGQRLAVLARPTRSQSARQRIEKIVARWEKELGEFLPRPVILEGDLSQNDLDLDSYSLQWISRNCRSVIHNAASLTFHSGNRESEPWLSNVGGTARMLELCRHTGIRQFYHVSTAYVCGLRNGAIFEDQLDLGQKFGNDYER